MQMIPHCLQESRGQQWHSQRLCQLAAREHLEPWTVKPYMLHLQSIVSRLVSTHFVVEMRDWAMQMVLAADAGLRVPSADRGLDVDP
jgi:hypothetical protein